MGAGPKQTHTLPAAYAIPVLEVVDRWGIEDAQLLGPFGLSRQDLADPNRAFPLDVALDIYERAVALTGDPALGIYLGLQMRATAHGILGFAAMSASSLREAIQEIGDRLGYSDVANFSRAFRRWTGVAPGAYRRGD